MDSFMLTDQEKLLMAVLWNQLSKPLNPDSLPCLDDSSAPLVAGSESDLPFVSQVTGD